MLLNSWGLDGRHRISEQAVFNYYFRSNEPKCYRETQTSRTLGTSHSSANDFVTPPNVEDTDNLMLIAYRSEVWLQRMILRGKRF